MYLFTYFKGNGEDGLHLAISDDGFKYRALHGDKSVLAPSVGESKLMRDPCVCRGPDGTWHMVWTTSWTGTTIGYASTKDFVHWTPQRAISVMAHEPTTLNCWAPEILFDATLGHFIVFWSSTIPGRFPAGENSGDDKYNHRIYHTITTDFEHFEPTKLFYDPGFSVIDATFLKRGDALYWIVKDETKTPPKKHLRMAKAEGPTGPFGPLGEPFTESWVEGPTALPIGDDAVVFYDCYTRHHYGARASRDLATWTEVTDKLAIPGGARHGTIVAIDDAFGRKLEQSFAAPATTRVAAGPLIPQRADPFCTPRQPDGFYYFTASVPEYDRVEIRRSETIAGLATAEPKVVWRKHPRGIMGGFIWAPELHRIDGKWYVYVACGRSEAKFDIRVYALVNENVNPLEGEWKEAGQVKMKWESFSLDATTFVVNGQRYFCWAQHEDARGRGTSLYLDRMTDALTLAGEQVCITSPDLPWERIGFNVNEGPAALIRNGRVFLTYSASRTDANYCMGMLTADEHANLMDPKSWAKSPTPVLKTDPAVGQYGPGHNSFTVAEDGVTDVLVYHARTYEKIVGEPLYNPDRGTFTRSVKYRADGTPIFTA